MGLISVFNTVEDVFISNLTAVLQSDTEKLLTQVLHGPIKADAQLGLLFTNRDGLAEDGHGSLGYSDQKERCSRT